MSRPLRIQVEGLTYHIQARGNARRSIFLDDQDRYRFLDLLEQVVDVFGLICYAYCLMTTHYHLVATTTRPNLSRALKQLNATYAQSWNKRHGSVGHVFQGRFAAQVIEDDLYFLTACRYVVLNPVRARMTDTPEEWEWSSHNATAGLAPVPPFLRPDRIWARLADDSSRPIVRYREYIASAVASTDKLPRGPVLGNEAFVAAMKAQAACRTMEVTKRDRLAPPRLEHLFAGAARREDRSARAQAAYRHGYTMAELARYLGVHYSTVSRMIAGSERAKTGIARPDP